MPEARTAELEGIRAGGTVPVNGVEIAYEELGDPDGEPLLLVMGLGMQLTAWPAEFCAMLTARGHRVIRFDNRDAGLSTHVDAPAPSRAAMLAGRRRSLAYTLDEMADDAAGLLAHLGIERAHVAGASMGGMIAQVIGYRHPERVGSLALIMTGAGKRVFSLPRIRILGLMLMRAPDELDAYLDHMVRVFRLIGSPAHPMPEDLLRELLIDAYRRSHDPDGVARQLHAITASGDRSRRLRGVRAETVVIHGSADPLVRPSAGRWLARVVPGARIRMIEGMGHDLPPELWPEITGVIAENARRAGSVRATAGSGAVSPS